MIRRATRMTVAVLLAYLLQTTALPYLKIGGIIIDLLTITLYTIGYAMGPYPGLATGTLAALIMEVVSGDLPGLTAILCIAAGGFGAWSAWRIRGLSIAGLRRLEGAIKRFGPILCIAVFEIAKEALYVGYFYLTGMDITFRHVLRAFGAGALVGVVSLLYVPLLFNMLTKAPEDTFMAKWLRKRREKGAAKKAEPKDEPVALPEQGGMDL